MFIIEGSQDRNPNRSGNWRQELMEPCRRGTLGWDGGGVLTGSINMACSACFCIKPRTTNTGMAPFSTGWTLSLPIDDQLKKNALQLGLMESLSQLKFPPVWSLCQIKGQSQPVHTSTVFLWEAGQEKDDSCCEVNFRLIHPNAVSGEPRHHAISSPNKRAERS